jgi:Cu/Ag efflux protein CusF
MKIKTVKSTLLITTFCASFLALPMVTQTAMAQDASPAASATKASSTHITGSVTAVDASAKTITITSKTAGAKDFTVSDSTKITGADGSAATLADIKTGDHVRATFKTGDDGKDELVSLKVGSGKKSSKQ